MAVKKFFKKVGMNLQRTGGALTTSAGKGLGGVLGAAAGRQILAGLTTAAPIAEESAPLLLLKTGGYIPVPRNKPRLAILHGGESVIPANAKVTKAQKAVIASNKNKKKLGSFVYN
jgi:hypothetical protein